MDRYLRGLQIVSAIFVVISIIRLIIWMGDSKYQSNVGSGVVAVIIWLVIFGYTTYKLKNKPADKKPRE